MLKAWKAVGICILMVITMMIELLFIWCKPIRNKARRDEISYILKIAQFNREAGNYEMADYMENYANSKMNI